jgi:hypothetical protein
MPLFGSRSDSSYDFRPVHAFGSVWLRLVGRLFAMLRRRNILLLPSHGS